MAQLRLICNIAERVRDLREAGIFEVCPDATAPETLAGFNRR